MDRKSKKEVYENIRKALYMIDMKMDLLILEIWLIQNIMN